MCPPKIYLEALIPSPSQYDLIWREGLYRGNQVKIRPLEWPLIHYDWVLIKRANVDIDILRERIPCEEGCRNQGDFSTCQGVSIIASMTPEGRVGATNRSFSHSLQKDPTLPASWLWTSSLQNCQTINFCFLSHPIIVFCYSSPRKLIPCPY